MAPSKADGVIKAQPVSSQGFVCAVCRKMLLSASVENLNRMWENFEPEQTYEVFENAVKSGCYVCVAVRKQGSRYQYPWLQLPELWEPLAYRVSKNEPGGVMEVLYVTRRNFKETAHLPTFSLYPHTSTYLRSSIVFPSFLGADELEDEHWPFGVVESKVHPKETLKTAKTWLKDCLLLHKDCGLRGSEAPRRLPTRLIDVGKHGDAKWRLCVPSEDRVPPLTEYLTLSYRWGPNPDILLLSSNLTSFRNGRPLDELPILFQDVIKAARYFGIRYVWIDALCIIQDSIEDWDAESPTMGRVYSNGRCNIAAIASNSPKEGLFHKIRDLKAIGPGLVEFPLHDRKPRYYYIWHSGNWDWQVSESALFNRGWVFQERWSSSRIIYFGRNQIFFECSLKRKSEAHPEGESNGSWHTNRPHTKGDTLSNLIHWNSIIWKYSKCDLTKATDKLAALAGTAKAFQHYIEGSYVAGLWSVRLISTLNWVIREPQRQRPPQYRAPSWSWASVDGTIIPRYLLGFGSTGLAEVVKVEVTTRTTDPMSTVLAGFVRLRGRLIPITVPIASEDGTSFVETDIETIAMRINPDVLDGSVAVGTPVILLPMEEDLRVREVFEVHGLLLEIVPQLLDCRREYRRVGQFCVKRPRKEPVDWFKYKSVTFDIV